MSNINDWNQAHLALVHAHRQAKSAVWTATNGIQAAKNDLEQETAALALAEMQVEQLEAAIVAGNWPIPDGYDVFGKLILVPEGTTPDEDQVRP